MPLHGMPTEIQILDGPMGTELAARGIATPLPGWSAHALETHPDAIRDIHRDYASAGASIHTTNTFRTHARQFPENWEALTERAVELARAGLEGSEGRLAGSMSPLEAPLWLCRALPPHRAPTTASCSQRCPALSAPGTRPRHTP